MKTFKQFIEGLEDEPSFKAISQAASDEAKDPVKHSGSKLNKIRGGKLLKRLLSPFTDKV